MSVAMIWDGNMHWTIGLNMLRKGGWSVAVHNDYKQNGVDMTFWLFTHSDGRWCKGEGKTDFDAIEEVLGKSGLPCWNCIGTGSIRVDMKKTPCGTCNNLGKATLKTMLSKQP